jgi:hypothetical protein
MQRQTVGNFHSRCSKSVSLTSISAHRISSFLSARLCYFLLRRQNYWQLLSVSTVCRPSRSYSTIVGAEIAMAPKQATLGYVKPAQMTIRFVDAGGMISLTLAIVELAFAVANGFSFAIGSSLELKAQLYRSDRLRWPSPPRLLKNRSLQKTRKLPMMRRKSV